MSFSDDGRVFRSELEALAATRDDGMIEVRAPAVGWWRSPPPKGVVVQPGTAVGELEVLGVRHRLVAPATARGMIVELPEGPRRGRIPAGYAEALMVLDPEAAGVVMEEGAAEAERAGEGGLVFRAPSSGRFYSRPSPDKPAFVEVGDEIEVGHTVCLLEVMKTFNRVQYGGSGLPDRARVLRVVPDNESDLDSGDPILELEPV